MTDGAPSHSGSEHGTHLLLYDGACGLCSRLVQFVILRDRREVFDFASLSSPAAAEHLAPFGSRAADLDTMVVVANYRRGASKHLQKARAALFVLKALGWPWRAAAALTVVPTVLLDRAYDVVARHRHRFFPPSERCFVPRAQDRHRFLDDGPSSGPKR